MSGICDTCRRESCHARMDGMKSCGFHEGGETRYERLFGTPEKAALLIAYNCAYMDYCGRCLIRAANCDGKYSTVLEWLKGVME